MNRYARLIAILVFLTLHNGRAAAEIGSVEARESIRRAVEAIRSKQKDDGSWPMYAYKGGASSLCVLALLNAGVPADDPAITRGINYLRKLGLPESVYATSLQTMVYCIADPQRYRLLIRRNVDWLQKLQVPSQKRGEGGWGYDESKRNPDNSNSQFAVLALHEAARAGIDVDRTVWERAVTYWKEKQYRDGSWGYRGTQGKGSMTCAGIGSLIMAQRNLTSGDALVLDGKVVCCGLHRDDDAVQRGVEWLDRNFAVSYNPSTDEAQRSYWLYYYLYGVERVGRLSGKRFIGESDWYREGVDFLIGEQTLKGEWIERSDQTHVTTALALLFLAKGRRPVLMSKLKHMPEDDWNRHRQDIGNLTRYVERRWGFDMTWQVIDNRNATVTDLLQSPSFS